MALPIGLQVYSVRDFAAEDFKGTMAKVKAMGYDGVETAGLYGKTAVEIGEMIKEAGLTWISAHVDINSLEDDDILDDYAKAGIKYIVIPWLMIEADAEKVAANIERIKAAGARAKARGMQLLYHNHDFEFEKVDDKYILDIYYSEIPDDLLQTEIDTCWVNVGGENPAAYVRKYAGKAPIVHLKDFAGAKSENMYALIGTDSAKEDSVGKFEFRPVGYGRQDVASLTAAAEEAGAAWLIVEQDSPSMDKNAMECVEMSIKYLRENYK